MALTASGVMPLRWMGGEENYDGLVPFETIVRKGVLTREIEDRKQALVEQCRTNSGLTLQEVIDHNDWLLQIERDLSKARSRIEREFRISNALSLKVREGKRKAQLQQRLDVLRAQCDVLNECIHGLSDHCAWFQESGTYREAVEYLEGRWDDEDGTPLDDARFDLRACGDRADAAEDGAHHELDGLIHSDSCAPSAAGEKKRRKKKKRKGALPGPEEPGSRIDNSDEEEDGEPVAREGSEVVASELFAADFGWLRSAGQEKSGHGQYVDVWAPD